MKDQEIVCNNSTYSLDDIKDEIESNQYKDVSLLSNIYLNTTISLNIDYLIKNISEYSNLILSSLDTSVFDSPINNTSLYSIGSSTTNDTMYNLCLPKKLNNLNLEIYSSSAKFGINKQKLSGAIYSCLSNYYMSISNTKISINDLDIYNEYKKIFNSYSTAKNNFTCLSNSYISLSNKKEDIQGKLNECNYNLTEYDDLLKNYNSMKQLKDDFCNGIFGSNVISKRSSRSRRKTNVKTSINKTASNSEVSLSQLGRVKEYCNITDSAALLVCTGSISRILSIALGAFYMFYYMSYISDTLS